MSRLPKRQPFLFDWTVTDQDGAGIDGCVVVANLYAGRSASNSYSVKPRA